MKNVAEIKQADILELPKLNKLQLNRNIQIKKKERKKEKEILKQIQIN